MNIDVAGTRRPGPVCASERGCPECKHLAHCMHEMNGGTKAAPWPVLVAAAMVVAALALAMV